MAMKRFTQLKVLCRSFSKNAKSFSEVPTPKSYPVLGHSYLFLPGGKYKFEKLTEAISDLGKTLGPIFKLNLGGNLILVTLDADDTQTLFRHEGKLPERPTFPALLHYRKKTFNSVGIVPGNGEEWYRLRSGVTPLLKPDIIKAYERKHVEIADKFVNYIKKNRNKDEVLEDIFEHLMLYTIEAISVVCPGENFGCLDENNQNKNIIIKASIDFMDGLYGTLLGLPVWKIIKNSSYRKLESAHNVIHKIIKSNLDKQQQSFLKNPTKFSMEQPFLYCLLKNEKLSKEDVIMIAMETFLGGIDATATTAAFCLHYLAKDKEIQRDATQDVTYLRACLKETLRLKATAGANSRYLLQDTEMGGYIIPKSTLVSAFSSVTSYNSQYFKNPDNFNPNRWLRDKGESIHPYASLPFGHGSRMCPGRRIAENEIIILLKQILKHFTLKEVSDDDVGMVYRMNRIPESPINIKFVNTNC